MKKTIVLTVCLFLLSQQVAQARNRGTLKDGFKSKATARELSFLCTFVPVVAGAVIVGSSLGKSAGQETSGWVIGLTASGLGLIIGPITGHNYAGKRWSTPGLKFRIAGLVCGGAAALMAASVESIYRPGTFEVGGDAQIVIVLIAAGVASELIAVVVDLATVGRSVDEYNRNHASGQLSIAPEYNPTSETFGLTATFRF